MKIKQLFLPALAIFFAAAISSSCTKSPETPEAVDLVLDKTSVEMNAGSTETVSITKGNDGYSVKVAAENIASATLSGKTITVSGIAAGSTTATVSDKQGKIATLSIKVNEKPKEYVDIELDTDEICVMEGQTGAVLILKGNGGYKVSSADASVATASLEGNGILINGISQGQTQVTVTDDGQKKATVDVTVTQAVDQTAYGVNMGEGYGFGNVGSHVILRCPIVRTYSEEYDFTRMSAATIECLVKINENPTYWFDDDGGNWLNSLMGSPDYFWLRINNPTVDKDDYPSDFKFNAAVDGVELNSASFPYGEWHHVALTFKNGEINLYVDGELAETGAANISYLDLTKTNAPVKWEDQEARIYNKYYDFFLGCWNQSRWLNGCMSEARLWSVARSAEQLSANATFLDVNDEEASYGLIAYWKLRGEPDPESGDISEILKDYSENSFDLEELSGNPFTQTMIKVPYGENAD